MFINKSKLKIKKKKTYWMLKIRHVIHIQYKYTVGQVGTYGCSRWFCYKGATI